jgi:hypothetical protein
LLRITRIIKLSKKHMGRLKEVGQMVRLGLSFVFFSYVTRFEGKGGREEGREGGRVGDELMDGGVRGGTRSKGPWNGGEEGRRGGGEVTERACAGHT